MPKKISSFFLTSDANCNELRVLRARPKKLLHRTKKVTKFCDSFKSRSYHFQNNNNKKGKLSPFGNLHGFVASENILKNKHTNKKSKLRPLSNSNRNSNSANFKNNIVSLKSLKKKHPNRMAVDFDHLYIDCGDSKLSIGRDIEFQHLKQLNLLHVDLIQQQNEQLKAKDKIIKSLQEDNKNLKARLDRLEQEIRLNSQKKDFSTPISVQTDFNEALNLFNIKTEDSPRINDKSLLSPHSKLNISIIEEESLLSNESSSSKKDHFRKSPKHIHSQLSPLSSSSPKVSPRELRSRRDLSQSLSHTPVFEFNGDQNVSHTSPHPLDSPRKLRSPQKKHHVEDTLFQKKSRPPDLSQKGKPFNVDVVEDEVTDHNLRSRHRSANESSKTEPETISLHVSSHFNELPEKQVTPITLKKERERWSLRSKTSVEAQKVRGEGILTTLMPYHLYSYCVTDLDDEEGEEEEGQTQVEIPQWRVRPLNSLYIMEGTENLEDEIFDKRHSKPEFEEKRRKRWDLQRMREQRQYEKLRERYESRKSEAEDGLCAAQNSLWPVPDALTNIQIDSALPVCAFGQNLVHIPECDFEVPWLSVKAGHPQLTKRKKK